MKNCVYLNVGTFYVKEAGEKLEKNRVYLHIEAL